MMTCSSMATTIDLDSWKSSVRAAVLVLVLLVPADSGKDCLVFE